MRSSGSIFIEFADKRVPLLVSARSAAARHGKRLVAAIALLKDAVAIAGAFLIVSAVA
jgi:uncharacterized membrane protein